jgi:hypothetical protein
VHFLERLSVAVDAKQTSCEQKQLADVQRPVIECERLDELRFQRGRSAPGVLAQKLLEQRNHVLAAFPKRGQYHRQAIQPCVKVRPKPLLAYRAYQRLLSGGDDPNVDVRRHGFSQGEHLTLLDRAKELGLYRRRQIESFIKEQRPRMCRTEKSGARLFGSGKRSLAVPEQLGLGQMRGDGRAVDGNEGAVAPAPGVNRPRHSLLAGSRFTLNDDRQIGRESLRGLDCRGKRRTPVPSGGDLSELNLCARSDNANPLAAANHVPHFQSGVLATDAVHKDAVAAFKVPNGQDRTIDDELRMPAGNLRSREDRIARWVAPDDVPVIKPLRDDRREHPRYSLGPTG